MSDTDSCFPHATNSTMAGCTKGALKSLVGMDLKADAADLTQEVINRANADIALATAVSSKADASHTHPNATTSTPGFQSAEDKLKLEGLSSKRRETFSGTTNSSGIYSATFSPAYPAAPNIQANIIGATDTQNIRITAISSTGFTVTVRNRVDVIGLLPSWQNVNGANVDVSVIEK